MCHCHQNVQLAADREVGGRHKAVLLAANRDCSSFERPSSEQADIYHHPLGQQTRPGLRRKSVQLYIYGDRASKIFQVWERF